MLARSLDRDFVGYGPTPPDPRWPDGARLALNFVLITRKALNTA